MRKVTGRVGALVAGALVLAGALVGCGAPPDANSSAEVMATPLTGSASAPTAPAGLTGSPLQSGRPAHIMVVVLENKASGQVDGNPDAPYLNSLAASSAVLTEARAVTHPSQPNYVALFSGSTHGVTSDQCPLALGDRPNLGRQLIEAGLSFTGYSEGLPEPGFTGCSSGRYAAKHNPFQQPPQLGQPAGQRAAVRLLQTADGGIPHSRPVPRHARLLDRGRRLVDA